MPNMRDVAREAHAAYRRCKSRGISPRFFESDDGNGRNGWSVTLLHCEGLDEYYETNNYEERWGDSTIFLGEDGMLYVHDFRGQELGSARSGTGKIERSTSNRVRKAEVNDLRDPLLVLKQRKPYFSAVFEDLRSLPR